MDDEALENDEVIIFALRTLDQDSRITFDTPVAEIMIPANDGRTTVETLLIKLPKPIM